MSGRFLQLLLLASWLSVCFGLKLAAFNIQVFGRTKARKAEVLNTIVQILRRYDIVFIQEIRDRRDYAIRTLMKKLNAERKEYNIAVSKRLGRTHSKEQYAYLYRNVEEITLNETYLVPDRSDVFEREPFAALFSLQKTEIRQLVLIGIHVSPRRAQAEINQLDEVREAMITRWGVRDVIIMGDMNADCRYLSQRRQNRLDLRTETENGGGTHNYWLIPDNADTTVSRTKCAYDRFIASGPHMPRGIINGSARIFTFDAAYKLNYSQAIKVSDHYPIELELKNRSKSYHDSAEVHF